MAPTKQTLFYGYLRVSTKRQASRRGKQDKDLTLSQETQLEIIKSYINSKGGKLVGYETEIESGTNADRPVYRRVVNQCSTSGYTLITAFLDRLHRNVEAMAKLMNSKIDFVFCDFPQANKLTIHILSAIAEYQSDQTKQKIKATIDRKKELKIPMGDHPNTIKALAASRDPKKATLAKQDKAYFDQSNIDAGGISVDKRNLGWTYKRIADYLNSLGKTTRTGMAFTPMAAKILFERYSAIPIESQLQARNAVITTILV